VVGLRPGSVTDEGPTNHQAGNQVPDHVTIARFRARHEQALAGFLVESLKLCAAAGMVRVGTVALDGTKLAANAADKANRTHDKLQAEVAEILHQAAAADQHEDRLFGDVRGDELPAELASKAGRLARLRRAKAKLEAEAAAREQAYQQRVAAHTAAAKATGRRARTLRRRPQEAPNPKAVANTTDPCSRFLHTRNGTVQGYNAQAVTTENQLAALGIAKGKPFAPDQRMTGILEQAARVGNGQRARDAAQPAAGAGARAGRLGGQPAPGPAAPGLPDPFPLWSPPAFL
jgi:hypothetical protein